MLKKITKITSRLKELVYGGTLSKIYSPRKEVSAEYLEAADLQHIHLCGDNYSVARIFGGKIYTNRVSNVSVMLGDYVVSNVSWQFKNDRNSLVYGKDELPGFPKHIESEVASLLTGGGGNNNYYHWMVDSLPRIHLIKSLFPENNKRKYYIPEYTQDYQKETLRIQGIDEADVISSENSKYISTKCCYATSHPNPKNNVPKWIISFLRKSFLKNMSKKQNKRIYISRDDSVNKRNIVNEKELKNRLKKLGFKSYKLSNLDIREQANLFNQARVVVGVHGAGLTNLVFSQANTRVIEILSDNYSPQMYKNISKKIGARYQSVHCQPVDGDGSERKKSIVMYEEGIENIVNIIKTL